MIVSERTLEATGVPANIKAVFIPNLKIPFSDMAESALKHFMSGGGNVFLVGAKCESIEGAKEIKVPLKTLWDVGGFPASVAFFAEFKKVKPALESASRGSACRHETGLIPRRP